MGMLVSTYGYSTTLFPLKALTSKEQAFLLKKSGQIRPLDDCRATSTCEPEFTREGSYRIKLGDHPDMSLTVVCDMAAEKYPPRLITAAKIARKEGSVYVEFAP